MKLPAPMFKCQKCTKTYNTKGNLKRHENNTHFIKQNEKICEYCARVFTDDSSLKRHHQNVHSPNSKVKEYFECTKCYKFKTTYRNNLSRHYTHCKPEKILSRKFSCSLCDSKYRNRQSLVTHQQKVHSLKCFSDITRKCPLCEYVSSHTTREDIYSHFEDAHKIQLKWEELNFNSRDDFVKWKHELEADTDTLFIRIRGKERKWINYCCHRSGSYKSKGRNIRRLKITKSCKMGSFCPAVIKTSNGGDDKIKVMFLNTHVGHENELKYKKYTQEEKRLAYKIQVVRRKHKEGMKLNGCPVIKEADDKWKVVTLNQEYYVTKMKSCSNCLLLCDYCHACYHEYMCSCLDRSIRNNMCKHIHLVISGHSIPQEDEQNSVDYVLEDIPIVVEYMDDQVENDVSLNEVVDNVKESNVRELLDKLLADFNKKIAENVTSVEDFLFVKTRLSALVPDLQAVKDITASSSELELLDVSSSTSGITSQDQRIMVIAPKNNEIGETQLEGIMVELLQDR